MLSHLAGEDFQLKIFEEFKQEFMVAKSSDSFFTEIAEKYPDYRNVLTEYISCLEVEEQKYARKAEAKKRQYDLTANKDVKIEEDKKRTNELEEEAANMDVKIEEDKKRIKELEEEAANMDVKIAEYKKRTKEFEEEAAKYEDETAKDIAKIAEQKRRKYTFKVELEKLYEKEIQKRHLEIKENFQNQFGANEGSALLEKISEISVG